jgi:tetratricopeptide (TPR) repeat protein
MRCPRLRDARRQRPGEIDVDASIRQQLARFEADPDATAAFEALEEHFFMIQTWDNLAALYRSRLEARSLAEQPGARAQLLLRLGQLLEEHCGDVDRAIDAYQDAVRLDPQLRPALRHLRSIYMTRGSWETVLQIAELETVTCMPPEERARVFSEMGDIWQRELGDAAQAEQCYARARSEALPTRPDAGAAEMHGDGESLVQQAWLAAARGDSATGLAALHRALEIDPADADALDMMATVLEGIERHAEMTDFLERRAALATSPETRGAVLARLGAVREEQLGDLGGARSAYERALSADPSNVAARQALIRIYRLTEAWSRLRTLLESMLTQGIAEDPAQVLCDLGALLETQFDDADAATSAYEEALALAPEDSRAEAALTRLCGTANARDACGQPDATQRLSGAPGSFDEASLAKPGPENRVVRVEGVLERKLESLEASGEGLEATAVSLRLRIAELRSAKRDNLTGAIEVLEPVLQSDTALVLGAERLAALYERAGRYSDLARLSRRVANLVSDPDRQADWYRRAAETARGSGDAKFAAECYERLLEERPQDLDAKAALLELHRGRGDVEALARALQLEILRAEGEREIELHLELADLLANALEDSARALLHLRRVLELAPSRNDALEQALRIAGEVGGDFLRLDLLDHLVDVTADAAQRARLLELRGDLLADSIGWQEEGQQSREAALAPGSQREAASARAQA